ncbi:alpha-ketoglutarate-dependent dioxygenase AlkB [Flavobacterium agricola]|uniref:Alpha-ketoglutarate-dependent dioxygenase AlkB n=1 Tax=Flavobacterium agricola TaxID=2870839 RepID=A0ABY6LZ86_9FLAO|nr:alpha-ketoglutarate-dependent dioxygenase AlkB [Flavobacterium agricola]UYW01638.1 alpha-ketoglutarate-dependent dioxygenase AlkB [Flavobacterium agricola]
MPSLFDQNPTNHNILPYQGEAIYYGFAFSDAEATAYFNLLFNQIEWQNDQALIFGKLVTTKRKVAWYGTQAFSYTYSNIQKTALPFTADLLAIKAKVEQISGATYNSCLLNLYHDGSEGMAWHSDAEKQLQKNGAIASVSFGATRTFCFKHKTTKEKIDVILPSGSLLVMQGETQTHWLHRLPPTKKVIAPRINLTFRTIVETQKNDNIL